ncbi:MAG TPA: alanyl-tRNA editing protein [Bryobacteraceae bacterium]|jgi:alanyl-tRNA synthetase|nr:alanyl-tRNA editing protein [Bryobacteraceae bacterium]
MTERLYYQDCYLRDFRARIVDTSDDGRRVYLDRTAFYPTSGGQPFDVGTLGGAKVIDVIDEEERIAHVLATPVASPDVEGHVDWERRFDHMQQHTGQHLLSAVIEELFAIPTLSFHMGADLSTIEVGAAALDNARIERIEERCAEIVSEARPVVATFDEASEDLGLRKASQRSGTLRVVSITGIDRSACGGTHVRSTAEIGLLLIRKLDKIRGNVRLEFVCGFRALKQARADFRTLLEISRHLSTPIDQTPAVVAAQGERLRLLEKSNQRLSLDVARREGRELWEATAAGPDGIRRVTQPGSIDDAMRVRAQAFAAQGSAVFIAVSENPPAVLLAASADSGLHAGKLVQAAVTTVGGRGGGNQALAQGSVPSNADLNRVVRLLNPAN